MSRVCPDCGHAGFKGVRPNRLIAFTWDRVCKECDTRYTPPTPVWAGVVFILAGLPLVLVGLLSLLGQMMARPNPLGLACTGFLGLLGLLAILQGVRTLSRPGKV